MIPFSRVAILLTVVWPALVAPATAQDRAAAPATVAAIRDGVYKTPAARTPVRLHAVVTLNDTDRNLTFVQDATGGLSIASSASLAALRPGEAVDVTGRATMTRRGPGIADAVVTITGRGPMPAAQPVSADTRVSALDGRIVALRGVVRRVESRGTGTELVLRSSITNFTLPLPLGARPDMAPVDSVVAVQAVLSDAVDEDGTLTRHELLPLSPEAIRVESRAAGDPFSLADVSVRQLSRRPSREEIGRRVKVTGVVTRQRPGRSLYIRADGGPLYVETDLDMPVAPGDRVEAVGFPDVDEFAPYLAEATYRRLAGGPAPEPLEASVGELLDGTHDADLVRLDATYISGEEGREEFTLVMRDSDLVFNAHVLMAQAPGLAARLQPGSRLRLTGICSVVVDTDRKPRAFRLLLRTANDIVVVSDAAPKAPAGGAAPWWTWVALAVAAGALVLLGLAYRKGQDQEETIRRQQAREASLKARFDDLFERSSEIFIVHDRRGRIATINRAGEQATGYSREELRVLDPNWIVGPDYLGAINGMIGEGADSAPRSFRTEIVPRKGGRVPVDVHARVLVGDGQVVGITAIARDLSEREKLENELRQAQKMEAVGRLATGIAHDFNNLITVLLGYSDELIEHVPEESEWHRPAQEIRRAAERASGLTQQLLSFSRRQTSVPQPVDLNVTVANMEDLMRRLLGPEIRLEFSLAPDLGLVRADAAQMGQVVMNLIVNARDAMPSGGALAIETANVDLGSEHLDVIPGPHVMLAVRDTGLGMSEEVRKRLFEPFFTTKETGQGTGLGLSMVHAIVRQSMGIITVESEPGHGSTFRVYFPRVDDAAQGPSPTAPTPASQAVRGEGVILLAEDDQSVRRLMVTELSRRGFTVLEAEDGQAALEVFAANQDRVDALVTDVVMPRMNGADLAVAVEKLRPGTKVLFISGHPGRAGAGLNPTGATNLLMKPFTADALAARIKELLAGATGA